MLAKWITLLEPKRVSLGLLLYSQWTLFLTNFHCWSLGPRKSLFNYVLIFAWLFVEDHPIFKLLQCQTALFLKQVDRIWNQRLLLLVLMLFLNILGESRLRLAPQIIGKVLSQMSWQWFPQLRVVFLCHQIVLIGCWSVLRAVKESESSCRVGASYLLVITFALLLWLEAVLCEISYEIELQIETVRKSLPCKLLSW